MGGVEIPVDSRTEIRGLNVPALAKADGYDRVGLLAFRDHLIGRRLG